MWWDQCSTESPSKERGRADGESPFFIFHIQDFLASVSNRCGTSLLVPVHRRTGVSLSGYALRAQGLAGLTGSSPWLNTHAVPPRAIPPAIPIATGGLNTPPAAPGAAAGAGPA